MACVSLWGMPAGSAETTTARLSFLSANLPENMRDPTRIRDFGTAGSLLLDSMSILGSTLAHRGHFDRAFAILERAQAIPQKNAFDVTVVSFHHARAHLFRGDTDLAAPISRAAIEHATRVGLEFSLPWHLAMLGYAHALDGELETAIPLLETALERSQQIHVPYLTASISALLAETLAPRQPERALDRRRDGARRCEGERISRARSGAASGQSGRAAQPRLRGGRGRGARRP